MNIIKYDNDFTIDTKSGVPVYKQIVQWVEFNMSIGKFKAGDRLPTVRQLAIELKVNPNTVAKAYSELEAKGLVNTQVGYGTFIADKKIELSEIERRKKAHKLCANFIIEMRKLGYSNDEILKIIKNFLQEEGQNNV